MSGAVRDDPRRPAPKALLRDGFQRLRVADGFSHSRAMAFQLVLALHAGTIVLVTVTSELRWDSLSDAIIRQCSRRSRQGPAGDVFREAFGPGEDAGRTGSGWRDHARVSPVPRS